MDPLDFVYLFIYFNHKSDNSFIFNDTTFVRLTLATLATSLDKRSSPFS